MELLTSPLREQLLRNFRDSQLAMNHGPRDDFWPVVKLFAPWNQAVWLLTELDPDRELDRVELFCERVGPDLREDRLRALLGDA